jgi:hypothetical protein
VATTAIKRLARIGGISEGQLAGLGEYVRNVLAYWTMAELDPAGKFTRRELVEALEGALSAARTLELGLRKKWLRDEMKQFEIAAVRRDARSAAELLDVAKKCQAIHRQIEDEGLMAANLVQRTGAMLERLETMPERPEEQLKRKGATKSAAQYLACCVLQFWIIGLSRPASITPNLIAFADQVFRLAGHSMKAAALEKRLRLELSGSSERCDSFLVPIPLEE